MAEDAVGFCSLSVHYSYILMMIGTTLLGGIMYMYVVRCNEFDCQWWLPGGCSDKDEDEDRVTP